MSQPQSQTVSLSAAGTVQGMTEPLATLEVLKDMHTDTDRAVEMAK